MSRRLVIWAALEGIAVLAIGLYTSFAKALEGRLAFTDWTEWVLMGAVLIAGWAAIRRPQDFLFGASAFAVQGAWWAADSLSGQETTADPIYCTGLGILLLLIAVVGARREPDSTAEATPASGPLGDA